MDQICVLCLRLYGKMLPPEDTFMFHSVDKMTGKSIIACHSTNPKFFKLIGEATPLIKESREKHMVVEDNRVFKTDNYWDKKASEALRLGISTISYLSIKNTRLPKRVKEYNKMLAKSVGSTEFTNLIKNAMVKAKSATVCKVTSFFERNINNINIEKDIER